MLFSASVVSHRNIGCTTPGSLPYQANFRSAVVNDLKSDGFIQPIGGCHVAPDQSQTDTVKAAVQQVAWDVADAAK